jgi:hypothetical protein
MEKQFYFVSIQPASGGFGMYQANNQDQGEYCDESCITEILNADEYYELGIDELPGGVEDITGKIYGEPTKVYAVINDNDVSYVGFNEKK